MCGSNPGSTFSRRTRLLPSSPAPSASTKASASSATTSRSRKLRRARPLVVFPRSFKASFGSAPDMRSAGINPNRMPVSRLAASVNQNTVASMRISFRRGISAGASAASWIVAQRPSNPPAIPPAAANSMLSASNCRTRRPRAAPSAARNAISLVRPAARASIRFATFTHAMSSTKPAAPISTQSALATPPTMCCCNGSNATLAWGGYDSGKLRHQAGHDSVQLRMGALRRHTRLQARDHLQVLAVAAGEWIG